MITIGIYTPTLGRPDSLQRMATNVAQTTEVNHNLVFVVERGDEKSYKAALAVDPPAYVLVNRFGKSYSNSIQTAFVSRSDPLFVCANDDFEFTEGWDTESYKVMEATGADVVGIDDGAPSCTFSTIALIRRSYINEQSGVIDMPRRVMYPYKHNFVDTELYQTAYARGVFQAAPKALIRHNHPDWGHVQMDSTYLKSRASLSEDGHTFNERAHLWQDLITQS